MKLFRIKGGVNLEGRKELTSNKDVILDLKIPDLLHIPVQQHIGTPAAPLVEVDDYVLKGQLIADGIGAVSAPIHAPTSGTILRIGEYPVPHPSGLPALTMTLEPDGLDKWCELPKPLDPETASAKEIAERVSEAGIVGMGGATFPSAVKLNLGEHYSLDMLVINGAECEPYLTCDDRIMRDRPEMTIKGVKAMMKALGVSKALIAIEKNKPDAFHAMEKYAADYEGITVVDVPARYPMGSEKHLVQALTGRETPAAGLTADLGVVVHNVATAFAIYGAVYHGRPLISRVVTVSGRAIKKPGNYYVLIGTPISFLIDICEGLTEKPKQLLMGGPMMGQPIPNIVVPIIKGSSGILALTDAEIKERHAMPCIRCGGCVAVCPCGLVPLELAALIRHDNLAGAAKIGLKDCVGCGSCSYICPAHLPLVQYFNYAKGRLKADEANRKKQEKTKILVDSKNIRKEEIKRIRMEKFARQKAEVAKAKLEKEAKGAEETL